MLDRQTPAMSPSRRRHWRSSRSPASLPIASQSSGTPSAMPSIALSIAGWGAMSKLVGEALHRTRHRHAGGGRRRLVEHQRQFFVAVLHLQTADDRFTVFRPEPLDGLV